MDLVVVGVLRVRAAKGCRLQPSHPLILILCPPTERRPQASVAPDVFTTVQPSEGACGLAYSSFSKEEFAWLQH